MRKMFPVVVARSEGIHPVPDRQYYFCNKTGLASLFKHDTFVSSIHVSQKQNKYIVTIQKCD